MPRKYVSGSYTLGVRARNLALKLRASGSQYVSPSMLCRALGVTDKRSRKIVKQAVTRMHRRRELPLLPKRVLAHTIREGRIKGAKMRWALPENLMDLSKRFRGKARKVCEHILQNIVYYNDVPSEDVSSIIFKKLRVPITSLIMQDVVQVVRRLRNLEILPKIPDNIRGQLASLKGRKGAMALLGKETFFSDIVRAHVAERIKHGEKLDEISAESILRSLKHVKGLTDANVKKIIQIMRRKSRLRQT